MIMLLSLFIETFPVQTGGNGLGAERNNTTSRVQAGCETISPLRLVAKEDLSLLKPSITLKASIKHSDEAKLILSKCSPKKLSRLVHEANSTWHTAWPMLVSS
ncbi:hypothetical protein ZHAS_00019889 [Anopheles sinensis]|uniref:Uncharacterized protein n=1 Tax=Anopheles sinensis TaxID=74873 RepID=A0A084WMG7_ANOSI|nr:hypothetical protein ZHAS_00019889 [Anopheles sinensis]